MFYEADEQRRFCDLRFLLYLGFHFLEMLVLRVKLRSDNLHLVDGFGCVAEVAWWPKPFGAW